MDSKVLYGIAADAVLFAHTLLVAFVVVGLVLILAGRHFSSLGVASSPALLAETLPRARLVEVQVEAPAQSSEERVFLQ